MNATYSVSLSYSMDAYFSTTVTNSTNATYPISVPFNKSFYLNKAEGAFTARIWVAWISLLLTLLLYIS